MSSHGQPVMRQVPHAHTTVQPPHDRCTLPTQLLVDQISVRNVDKSFTVAHESLAELKHPARIEKPLTKNNYVPIVLRTRSLVAFCVVVSIVFVLLQVVSVKYIQTQGFEDKGVAKRAAYTQNLDSNYLSENTGLPTTFMETYSVSTSAALIASPVMTGTQATGSWINSEATDIPPVTAPPPGSYTPASATYFLGAYVPTLLAILLGIWWKCISARLREMEPYYQLANKAGAQPKDSLFLSYPSEMFPLVLIKSFRSKHWLTFVGTVNMAFITCFTLFAAESVHLVGIGDGCGVRVDAMGASNDKCEMRLKVRPALGFSLGCVLMIALTGAVLLLIRLRQHPSGLVSEATSIAGIASLSNPVLHQEPPHSLRNPSRRFVLSMSESNHTNSIVETTSVAHAAKLQPNRLSEHPSMEKETHLAMHPILLVLFFFFQIAILVIVVYYRYVSQPGTGDSLEDFMDSETFGIRLFMTTLGLGVKFYWGWIETYVRNLSPYVALAAPGGALAHKSVLMTTSSHSVTAVFSRNTWKHGILGPVTLMAALSEVLVVMLNTVPFTDTTAYTAFEVSVYFCIFILTPMIFIIVCVIWWIMQTRKNISIGEPPKCIAEIFWMTGDTELWQGLGAMSEAERKQTVSDWNIKFATRQVQGMWRIVPLQDGLT